MGEREDVGAGWARRSARAARWAWVLGLVVWAGGCGEPDSDQRRDRTRPSRCDIETLAACDGARACADGAVCFEGCCHAPCATAGDCGEAAGCGAFGCVCDDGVCMPTSCSSDGECADGLACVGGTCEELGPVEVVTCELRPRWDALRPGDALTHHLAAFDAQGVMIPASIPFELHSSDPGRVAVVGREVRGGEERGEAEIVATAAGITCGATVLSLGPPEEEGGLRVLVVDGASRLPIEGALVQVEVEGASLSQGTDARGVAELPADALGPPPHVISAFHPDFTYLTVAGVGVDDVRLPLTRHEDPPLVGGFRGTFDSAFFQPSRVSFGLAGASIPGNLLDLEVAMLVGPIERVDIDLGGARSADLSAGLVFGLGNTWFKEEYRAIALAGGCDDREASLAGACGTRSAWGLAGGIPLEELPLDAIATEGEVDAGSLLAQLLPNVRRLRSAIVPSFSIDPRPRQGDAPPWSELQRLDLSASKRLSLRADVRLPSLPTDAVDGVVALVGARVPDRGMVPLGLTGALDEGVGSGGAPTGVVLDPIRGRRGVLDLRFAPLHGGLEGSEYLVMVLAVDLEGLSGGKRCAVDDRAGCTPISGLLASRASLPWGVEVDLSEGGFLGLADEATFDPALRRLDLGETIEGATLLRLQLEADGRKWQVVFPAAPGISVPVPVGVDDRVEGARASVQAIALEGTLDDLLTYQRADLYDFTLRAPRFSTIDLPAAP